MKPSFVGIGAQKCATSWLYRILEDHPEVALSQPKELHFFSAHFDRGYRWYERQFAGNADAKAVGEYSTSYLTSADAPGRVARYARDLRLIIALRDPVERAFSNHLHEVRAGHLGDVPVDFESAMKSNPMYVEQGFYARHLRRWLDHFDRSRFLVLFQEEIERSPVEQAATLYRFLGIDESHCSPYLNERVNASEQTRSEGLGRATRTVARAMRGVLGERFVRDLKTAVPVKRVLQGNRRPLADLVPPMREDMRRELTALFAADMAELRQILGRDDLPWAAWRDRAC